MTVELGGRAVVRDVSTSVERGAWVALIGPNGAGKTTAAPRDRGPPAVRRRGDRCSGAVARRSIGGSARAGSRWCRRTPETPPWLTVAEYVLLGRTPYLGPLAREGADDRDAAERALGTPRPRAVRGADAGTLSGGERQRVVVARALAQEASIVLLDEPTSALDIGHQQQALELLDALRATDGLTLVAAMHDLTLAAQYADRVLLLSEGPIVADGPPADVLTEEALRDALRRLRARRHRRRPLRRAPHEGVDAARRSHTG